MQRVTLIVTATLAFLLMLAGCAGRGQPQGGAPPPTIAAAPTAALPFGQTTPTAQPVEGITIHADGAARPFDRRLLGTNVPAWLGPERLSQPLLQERITALGPTLIRLPGGTWSNHYNWSGCERRDEENCYWPWAARPTDFLNFLRATGQEAIWTVSINGTAKEAAALVAFFNGEVDDERSIGVDVRGQDWRTVGYWARLRAEQGHPEPLPIRLWEVGNEVYGAKASVGPDCAPQGWEEVWTCDGVEYVFGKGVGSTRNEGYLEFREAMRAVDPGILVGAVGVESPGEWSNWGNEVIQGAGPELDFYVVHLYGYFGEPRGAEAALSIPQRSLPRMVNELHAAMDRYLGRRVPIAVTEYNLVAVQEFDNAALMRRAVNALFIADMIGQMAEQGVAIANQWNFANGVAGNGTDYGLIDVETFAANPQYFALAMWRNFGDELVPVESSFPADQTLSVYAGKAEDGTLTLLAINKTARSITTTVRLQGGPDRAELQRDLLEADSLEALAVRYNGVGQPAADFSDAPSTVLGFVGAESEQTFPPYSISLLRFTPEP